jgi:hypothetical protein
VVVVGHEGAGGGGGRVVVVSGQTVIMVGWCNN